MLNKRANLALPALAALGIVAQLAGPQVQAAEPELRMVSAFPGPLPINQPVKTFLASVKKQGKGVVKVKFLGGPEVTPPPDQPQALTNGVFEVLYFPLNYALGKVPEGDALIGATKAPWEVRKNGGWKILQEIYKKKLNAYLLSWPGTNFRFHIYTIKEPKIGANGLPDLSGLRIRSVPIYREVISKFNGTPVSIQIPEVYTALERGVIDGAAFPVHGLRPLSWNKHLHYQINPGFFNGDGVIAINLDKWNALSKKAKALLEKIAKNHERVSYKYFADVVRKEEAALRKSGMKTISLKGKARTEFLKEAYGVAWDRLAKASPDAAKRLKPKFYGRQK